MATHTAVARFYECTVKVLGAANDSGNLAPLGNWDSEPAASRGLPGFGQLPTDAMALRLPGAATDIAGYRTGIPVRQKSGSIRLTSNSRSTSPVLRVRQSKKRQPAVTSDTQKNRSRLRISNRSSILWL